MAKTTGLIFKQERPLELPRFICHVCGKEYKAEATLEKHIAENHTTTEPEN